MKNLRFCYINFTNCFINVIINMLFCLKGLIMKNRFRAFTLAEILIALTIIGVVAALTVPMLMSNTDAKTSKLRLRSAYNNISNAIPIFEASRLEGAANEPSYNFSDLNYLVLPSVVTSGVSYRTVSEIMQEAMTAKKTSDTTYTVSGQTVSASGASLSLNTYSSSATIGSSTSNAAVFKARDNSYYIFTPLQTSSGKNLGCVKANSPCIMYIDINGKKGPNEVVTCTSGTNSVWTTSSKPNACVVDESAVTDIYPFVVYGTTVTPATSACEAVLSED